MCRNERTLEGQSEKAVAKGDRKDREKDCKNEANETRVLQVILRKLSVGGAFYVILSTFSPIYFPIVPFLYFHPYAVSLLVSAKTTF